MLNVLIVSFWMLWKCVGSWFRWVRFTGFWLSTDTDCFPAEMFGDLFGSGRGRPSTPGSVVATVMVLQALECVSDREAVQRLRGDIAWKAAAGCL